jgi:hypothetical protein
MPNLPAQIRDAIAARGLSLYGASQIIGAETDEALPTIHRRLTVYTSENPPKAIWQLEEALDALGYRIEIVEK